MQLLFAVLFHESPRWILCVKKDRVLATSVLRKLRGYKEVDVEVDSISSSNNEGASGGDEKPVTMLTVFTDKYARWPLVIGVTLQIAQQLSGINAIMFYSAKFFQNVQGITPIQGTILVGIVNALFTVVSVALIEKLGRRFLLMLGTFIMLLSSATLSVALFNNPVGNPSAMWSWIEVGSVLVYVAAFEIGLGPIAWLMIAEIMPNKSRGPAISVAVAANWTLTIVVALGFPPLNDALGNFVFFPFMAVMIGFLLFGFVGYLPETNGKSLEQIQLEINAHLEESRVQSLLRKENKIEYKV